MVTKEDLRKLDKEQLVDLVYDLLIKVDALTAQVQILQDEVNRLKTPKNSGNSSLPPSHDLFRIKNQSLREKSGKEPGGQPGHKGETLLMSPDPDKIIEHRPDGICPRCGRAHTEGIYEMVGKRQVVDILIIKASAIEHQVFQSACSCGHVTTRNYPSGVTAPVQYGNKLIVLIAYLSSRQYVSYNRLSEMIKSITTIPMSEGTIYNLLNKAANMVLPIYVGIKGEVSKAITIGRDETGVKVKKGKSWAWTWQTTHATYVTISPNRGGNRTADLSQRVAQCNIGKRFVGGAVENPGQESPVVPSTPLQGAELIPGDVPHPLVDRHERYIVKGNKTQKQHVARVIRSAI